MGALTTAYVAVKPDTSKMGPALNTALRPIGIKAGQELADGIKRGADGRLRDARGKFVSTGRVIGESVGKGAGGGFRSVFTRSAEKSARDAGRSSGARFSSGFGDNTRKALGHGLAGAGVAAGAAFAGALTKGFGRLSAIENAEAKLDGLGHSAKTVDRIMVNALASVKGTAFGLDEASTLAATAVASGIKPGRELERTLKLVADAATIGGTSLGDMGAIFSQVAASNKVQGDTINQLNERGIPILKLLGDVMGKSQGKVSELASKGKIDFATFQKAMEKGLGGAALKSGQTATGAFKNMGAAFSRVGAALLKGVFPQMAGGFGMVTGWLDKITPAAARFGEGFGRALTEVSGGFRAFKAAWQSAFAGDPDVTSNGFAGFMERLANLLVLRVVPAVMEVRGGLRAFGSAWRAAFAGDPDVTSNGFAGFMERLANLIVLQVLPAMRQVGGFVRTNVIPPLRQLGQYVADTLLPAWLSWYSFLIKQMTPILKQIGGFVRDQVIPALGAVASFIASDVVPGFLSIVDTVKGLIRVVAPIISQIVGVVVGKFTEMRPEIASIWGSVKEIITGVMFVVKEVVQAVTTIIKLIWDRHGESIKKIVGGAFGAIFKTIAGVMKAIAGVIKLFVALIKGDWKGAWNAIKQIFAGVWQVIKAILGNVLRQIDMLLGGHLAGMKGKWGTFWSGIKTTTSNAMAAVQTRISTVLGRIRGAFQTAKDNIGRIWSGVKAVVSAPITWVKDNVYNRLLVPVWNRVAGLVGGPKLSAYARGGIADLERYANGGTPFGVRPGYTPGRDTHPIMVGGGEAIMRPEWTRAVGADYVNAANAAARRGAAGSFVAGREPVGFAAGGIVGWIKDKLGSAGAAVSGLAAKIKGFVMGGLRSAAGAILNPLKGVIDRAMPDTGVGNTVGGIGKKGIDLLLDKIGTDDAAAMAASAGAGAGWGGGSFRGLSGSQMRIAATIANVGRAMGKKAQLIGIITGIVESNLRNVNFGDRDSLGVFQQRAPWGPASVRRNVAASAGMFYHGGRGGQPGLDDIRGWQGMSPGAAAQRVQVSAFPDRYQQQVTLGDAILGALAGGGGGPAGTGSSRRVSWKGGTFTERFRNTLIRAQQLAGIPIPVIQGGFSRSVSASGTSHYGDAIDTRWNSRILSGLRRARVAAWHRTPAQGFSHHIHGVPLPGAGFPGGSGIWQAQDYLRGGNGLALGGIVRGGRGGITTRIGEGRHDELVQPLPRNWQAGQSRPIRIELHQDGIVSVVEGIIDANDEFHASVGRMRR